MSVRRYIKRPLLILLITLGVVAAIDSLIYFSGWPEGYCYFYPSLGTHYAPGYSEKLFDRVVPGMTENDIIALLGKPLCVEDTTRYTLGEPFAWDYSLDDTGFIDVAWLGRRIYFTNKVVIKKEKHVYYD